MPPRESMAPGSRWRRCPPDRRSCRPWWRRSTVPTTGGRSMWPGRSARSSRGARGAGAWGGVWALRQMRVVGRQGNLVPLGEVVRVEEESSEKSIHHKNLMPVVYVTADVAGEGGSPLSALLTMNQAVGKL